MSLEPRFHLGKRFLNCRVLALDGEMGIQNAISQIGRVGTSVSRKMADVITVDKIPHLGHFGLVPTWYFQEGPKHSRLALQLQRVCSCFTSRYDFCCFPGAEAYGSTDRNHNLGNQRMERTGVPGWSTHRNTFRRRLVNPLRSSSIILETNPMMQRYPILVLLPVLMAVTGCGPSEPVSDMPTSPSVSSDPTAEDVTADAGGTTTPVDPAIDAGMMADELEHSQRLQPKAIDSMDATIDTNSEPKD